MKVLIIAMPGCGNLGDDLISEILQKCIVNRYPDVQLGILCGDSSSFKNEKTAELLYYPRNIPGLFYKRAKKIKNFARTSDLIFVGGGGLFQDTHNYFTIHSYLHWLFYAHCPVYCVGMGVGPIKHKTNIKYLLNLLNREGIYIQLRDLQSYQFLDKLGMSNIELSCDIVEGSLLPLKKTSTKKIVLGCSIREWSDLNIEHVINFLNTIIEKKKVEMVKFFAFEHKKETQNEFLYLKQIADRLSTKTIVYAYGKDDRFLEELCGVTYAIASRYHANIIWQKLGVPVLPIPYAPKVYSLYSKSGIELKPFDSQDFCCRFVSINLEEVYKLPMIDFSKSISFTKIERMFEFIYHLVYLFCSIIKSLFNRIKL